MHAREGRQANVLQVEILNSNKFVVPFIRNVYILLRLFYSRHEINQYIRIYIATYASSLMLFN